MNNDYSYVKEDSSLGTVTAASPEAAISSAQGIAPDSGVITPTIKNQVSTLSTSQGQNIIDGATAEHANDMTKLQGNQQPKPTDGKTPKPPEGALSWDEATALGLDMNSMTRDTATNTFIPTANTKQQTKAQQQLKADEIEINDAFAAASKDADAATQSLISSISGIYGSMIGAMQEQNRRSLAGVTTSGIRSGADRYAGEVNQGILNAETRAGLMRVFELVAKQSQAIASANQALSDKKYSLFLKKRDELKSARSEMQKTLQKLQTEALATQKKNKEKQAQAKRDSAIAGILQQGVTDPGQILDYLNNDENGNMVGDFTADEVSKAVKSLSPEGDLKSLTGATKNFYILKQKGLLPESISELPEEEQLFSYLQKEKVTTKKITNPTTKETLNKPPPSLIDAGMQALHNPKVFGSDGYVDPFFYKAKFDAWIEDGYSSQDFIKHFPPGQYVNPIDNGFLPSYLQTKAKAPKAAAGGA